MMIINMKQYLKDIKTAYEKGRSDERKKKKQVIKRGDDEFSKMYRAFDIY